MKRYDKSISMKSLHGLAHQHGRIRRCGWVVGLAKQSHYGREGANLVKMKATGDESRLCGFEIESLESRRGAAAIGLALDLLDGKGYGELQDHVSTLIEPLKLAKKRTRQNVDAGTQLKPKTKTSSLDSFKSSYLGSIHKIWSRLPQSLVREGLSSNWSRIKSRAKKFCIGKWSPAEKTTRPQRKKIKKNENYSSKLNNELNAHTDWNAIRKDLKDQGISINKIGHL